MIYFASSRLFPRVWVTIVVMVLGCAPPAVQKGNDPFEDIRHHQELWSTCGTSAEGRPIYFCERGRGDSTVLVLGSMHGDEEAGGGVVIRLAEQVAAESLAHDGRRIVFVPVVNPDGVRHGTRWNARGVDINRNFPTANWERAGREGIARHGEQPASEPETQVVIDLIEKYKPVLIITLHAALHVVNYDGPAQAIAEGMGARNRYPVSGSIGYPTPGSLGTYAGVERAIPIITLELPRVGPGEGWEQNRDALLYAIGVR